jgi:hypothetical protein
MRVAHPQFRRYLVRRDVGFPRTPSFFANRPEVFPWLCEVSPDFYWTREVNGSIGFVVSSFWNINSRYDRHQGNQAYPQDNDDPE